MVSKILLLISSFACFIFCGDFMLFVFVFASLVGGGVLLQLSSKHSGDNVYMFLLVGVHVCSMQASHTCVRACIRLYIGHVYLSGFVCECVRVCVCTVVKRLEMLSKIQRD